jgi:transposase-like protein
MGAITAELVETGEKRDARGRRLTPTARRAQMVEIYRGSGLTMAAFARREKIKYATFAGWVAKAEDGAASKGPICRGRFSFVTKVWIPFTTQPE